jgi:hypothetical protein
MAPAEQPAPDTGQHAGNFARAKAEWVSVSPTAGRLRPEGEVQVAAAPPAPAYDGVEISRGHLPPPGKCRIWFPDRPPGHQPAPGSCKKLRYRVPSGAYLVDFCRSQRASINPKPTVMTGGFGIETIM